MVRKELIERSPLRILESSIHGGVGVGNIGVIDRKKGDVENDKEGIGTMKTLGENMAWLIKKLHS